jgi:mono/diheme cytochrome c family protein
MWRHGAALGAATPRPGATPPRLTPQDGADVVAYLHASHHFDTVEGDARQGSQLVHDRGCLACHAIYGRGGDVAPDLATANVVGSQAGQLAAMWNHGRYMETEAQRRTIVLPALTAQELADITRYLAGLGSRVPSRR